MAFATTFRHSATEPVRGREVDVNFDALGVYVDGTFLPLTGGTITGNVTINGNTTLTGTFSLNGSWDGWIGANETWTYASATTFTISGDLTGKYQKGDKIKLTQTTAKYFYVTAVSHAAGTTTVTVTGGTDYTLANAAITLPFYSKMVTPQGFPGWFNFTPAWTSSGTQPAIGNGTLAGRFSLSGLTVTVQMRWVAGNTTTFGTGVYIFAMPVPIKTTVISTGESSLGWADWVDISAGIAYIGMFRYTATGDTVAMVYHSITVAGALGNFFGSTLPATWADADNFSGTYTYEML